LKRILVAGLLGGIVLVAWVFLIDGVLGFKRSIEMNQIPDERIVYEILREHVVEPGGYICNPEITSDKVFPGDYPVFSIQYSGLGHASAGRELLFGLLVFLITPVFGAWMLSKTSERTLSNYPRKVLFFVVMGVVFGLFGDLTRFGIGGYPMSDAIALALHDTVAWSVVGLVVAWRFRPATGVTP